jgi:DNA-binding NtrC family response regulator
MSSPHYLNVLVVDRDEETNIALNEVLTEDGNRVTTLSEPTQIASEIRDNRYQIVILDVSPGTGGTEALESIRNQDSDLCVIATTGIASVEAAVATMKHQAFSYLQKPLDADAFRAVLQGSHHGEGFAGRPRNPPQHRRGGPDPRVATLAPADPQAARQPNRTFGEPHFTDRAREVRSLDVDAPQPRSRPE